jgi:hydroxymethylpyrimidine pyrophosphatase-like HAD family hydrolase
MEQKNQTVICFDVDDTLVIWGSNCDQDLLVSFNNYGYTENLLPHTKHIEQLKLHHQNGHMIIVWSQNGADWVEEVITKLNLTKYVHLMLTKPECYYDDIDCKVWMGERIYFKYE